MHDNDVTLGLDAEQLNKLKLRISRTDYYKLWWMHLCHVKG